MPGKYMRIIHNSLDCRTSYLVLWRQREVDRDHNQPYFPPYPYYLSLLIVGTSPVYRKEEWKPKHTDGMMRSADDPNRHHHGRQQQAWCDVGQKKQVDARFLLSASFFTLRKRAVSTKKRPVVLFSSSFS